MKNFKYLLLLPLIFAIGGCKQNNDVNLSGYSIEVKQAIKDLVETYKNKDNAYIVSDFDNTTVIFDIALQCSIYQLETMSFAVNSLELQTALSTSLVLDITMTNYIDDVTSSYDQLIKEYGSFSPLGVEEKQLSTLHSNIYWQEFSTKMKCLFSYVEDRVDDALACEWIMYWYTGMNEQEVYNMFKNSCEKYQYLDTQEVTWTSPESIDSKIGVASCSFILGCSTTESVKNMLKYYVDNGIDTWICSASHVDGVRGAIDAYDLSDYITGVIGMTQKMENGKFVPAYDYENGLPYINKKNGNWEKINTPIKALPSREGKVTAIKNALLPRYNNEQPLAGFMDASGDFNFCTEFSNMKMVICYNRANRKITEGAGLVAIMAMYQKENGLTLKSVNEKRDTYYLLQGRDENGKRSLRESNYTIRYGEKVEKLFAAQDNFTLFNYLKDNNLSVKDFYDTFAIKTGVEQSVIGAAYGHLDYYAGYHNI